MLLLISFNYRPTKSHGFLNTVTHGCRNVSDCTGTEGMLRKYSKIQWTRWVLCYEYVTNETHNSQARTHTHTFKPMPKIKHTIFLNSMYMNSCQFQIQLSAFLLKILNNVFGNETMQTGSLTFCFLFLYHYTFIWKLRDDAQRDVRNTKKVATGFVFCCTPHVRSWVNYIKLSWSLQDKTNYILTPKCVNVIQLYRFSNNYKVQDH